MTWAAQVLLHVMVPISKATSAPLQHSVHPFHSDVTPCMPAFVSSVHCVPFNTKCEAVCEVKCPFGINCAEVTRVKGPSQWGSSCLAKQLNIKRERKFVTDLWAHRFKNQTHQNFRGLPQTSRTNDARSMLVHHEAICGKSSLKELWGSVTPVKLTPKE